MIKGNFTFSAEHIFNFQLWIFSSSSCTKKF